MDKTELVSTVISLKNNLFSEEYKRNRYEYWEKYFAKYEIISNKHSGDGLKKQRAKLEKKAPKCLDDYIENNKGANKQLLRSTRSLTKEDRLDFEPSPSTTKPRRSSRLSSNNKIEETGKQTEKASQHLDNHIKTSSFEISKRANKQLVKNTRSSTKEDTFQFEPNLRITKHRKSSSKNTKINNIPKNTKKVEQVKNLTSMEDLHKLEIIHIVENQLCSDLNLKLFKRYCSQIQNNEKDFVYWNYEVEKEMYKVYEVISLEDLQIYMKSSLLLLISQNKVLNSNSTI